MSHLFHYSIVNGIVTDEVKLYQIPSIYDMYSHMMLMTARVRFLKYYSDKWLCYSHKNSMKRM